MQRRFCDCCGSFIDPQQLNGAFMKLKEQYSMAEALKNASNSKSQDQQMMKQVQPDVEDLCQDCASFIAKKLEERQKKLKKEDNFHDYKFKKK